MHKMILLPKVGLLKAHFSMKPAKKILSLLGGKIKFELALQPSTAFTLHEINFQGWKGW